MESNIQPIPPCDGGASRIRPVVVVESDFDHAFESMVNNWIDQKLAIGLPFKNEKVIITAGPYRNYAVAFELDSESKTICFDFYSALRNGFGTLSTTEVAEIIDLL